MVKKCVLLVGVLAVAAGCSSTKEFRAFSSEFPSEPLKQTPDITITPQWIVRLGKNGREKIVTWPGFIERVEPQPDKDGNTILVMKHRYLALNPPGKEEEDLKFYLSETSGGEFQCRVLFKKSVGASDFDKYLRQKEALTCTGKVLGFTKTGAPVVEAMQLETFPIAGVTAFLPVLESSGRLQMDEYGRPKYQQQNP
jgi:hypothetical protein